jgi:hypothetical protein
MPFSTAAIEHRKSHYCGSLLLEVLIYQPIYQNNMLFNYTIQDMFSLALAILLFTAVLVFPGYVIGWALNVFSFRQRTPFAQYVLAIALSNALIPALLFLCYRFLSNEHGIGLIVIFFILWIAIQLGSSINQPKQKITRELKISLALASLWILFCILLLVDIQIGPKLYFNVAAYDFTSRTPLIEAITRTGIPPINPTYYPGHFERITQLYYFWYIPGSVVDVLGGRWIDARIALFAGITWSGLSLAATIVNYLRIRNHQIGTGAYRSAMIGSQLIAISGLDLIPVIGIMIAVKTTYGILPFDGRVEAWNVPVMSWLNALTWVPNHVAGLGACMISLLAILSSSRGTTSQRWISILVAGISFGSAIGLSVWVALTFGIFMAIWCLAALFNRSQRSIVPVIVASGILGLVLVSQFLIEALQLNGRSSSAGSLPLGLYVRRFSLTGALAPGTREVVGTMLLPVNYLFELGFFFVIALLWFRQRRKSGGKLNNPYFLAETLLLATVVILLSFVRSTALLSNDLGMRGWLLGQFVLIVWAVDIFNATSKEQVLLTPTLFRSPSLPKRINDLLTILLTVGLLTTALEATATRFWTILVDTGVTGVPNELSPDTNLGERTYDARRAYEYIRDHTPQNMIIQNNPITILDRPSGLYGTRQMVIADRTAYGIPAEIFKKMSNSVGRIFLADNATNWSLIDQICRQYSIQAIVVNDTDPLWSSLRILTEQRTPIYLNRHYTVFPCGNDT